MIAVASPAASLFLSADSSSGAGTTVRTSLRAARGAPSAAAQPVSEETPGTTSTGKFSAMRAKRNMKEP